MSEEKTIREVIGEAIGEASMCWSKPPVGIFESERASALVDKILDAFHLKAGMNVTRWVGVVRAYDAAIASLKEAVRMLDDAIGRVTSEYCSHNDDCGKDTETCYARKYYQVLDKIKKDHPELFSEENK